MKSYTFEAYFEVGCPLRKPDASMLMLLVAETNGRVCTTGCFDFKSGSCQAYKRLVTQHSGTGPDLPQNSEARNKSERFRVGNVKPVEPTFKHIEYTETVAQEAERTGLSKSEVRRRRTAAAQL